MQTCHLWISIVALLAQLVFQTLEGLQHLCRIGRLSSASA